ncbi:MAG: hypothetical protein WD278_06155, partial [Pirellulales bacterium]
MLAKDIKRGMIVNYGGAPCLIETIAVQSPSARGAGSAGFGGGLAATGGCCGVGAATISLTAAKDAWRSLSSSASRSPSTAPSMSGSAALDFAGSAAGTVRLRDDWVAGAPAAPDRPDTIRASSTRGSLSPGAAFRNVAYAK